MRINAMSRPIRVLFVEGSPEDEERVLHALRQGGLDPVWKRVENADGTNAPAAGVFVRINDPDLTQFHDPSTREAQYRLLFESNPHSMWVYDIETLRFLDVNETAIQHYGYSRDEFLGMTIRDIRPPEDVPRLLAEMSRLTGRPHTQSTLWRHRKKDGTLIDVEISSNDIRYGVRAARFVFALDVSERLRLEAEMLRTSSLLKAVADGTPDAVFVKDRAGRYLLFNDAAASFVGKPVEEVIGRDDTLLFDPAGAQLLMDYDRRVMELNRIVTYEEPLTAAGVTRTYQATKAPYRDGDGNVIGVIGISRDITEQKKAEVALLQEREFMRLVLDTDPNLIFVKDADGRFVLANKAIADLYGTTPEALVGRRAGEGFPDPAEFSEYLRVEKKVLQTGIPAALDESNTRSDGRVYWFHTKKVPLVLPNGTTHVLGISLDITERKQADHALRLFRELIDRTSDAVEIIDPSTGRFLDVNETGCQIHGYTRAEYLALAVPDIDPAMASQPWNEIHEELRRSGVRVFETLHRRKDGSMFPVEVNITYIRLQQDYMLAVVRDISERKRIEQSLRQSEAHKAAILETALDAIITMDHEGMIVDFNPAAEQMFGHRLEEVVGKSLATTIIPPAYRQAHRLGMEHYLTTGEGPVLGQRLEVSGLRADGTEFPLELAITRISTFGLPMFTAYLRDISDRNRKQDQLRRSESFLRLIWESSADGMRLTDRAGVVRMVNEAFCRMMGRPRELIEGFPLSTIYEPANSEAILQKHCERFAAKAIPSRIESEVLLWDGRRVWFAVSNSFLEVPGDELLLLEVFRDVTARKRAETERVELLNRLTIQIERLPLAYLLCGPDFCYTRWNPAAERMFGFTQAEVLGRHPFEVVVPAHSIARVAVLFARLKVGDMIAHVTSENVTKSGTTIVCEWHNTPYFGPNGEFQGVLSIAQDVTARRDAERVLHLRDRAIQATSQGIVITDPNQPDSPIIYVSPSFERMAGYASTEVISRNCRFLQGKDTDTAVVAQMREAIRTAQSCNVELLNYRKDGTPFWNELSLTPVRDEAGRLTHFIGVQADVTARRTLEEQFRQVQKMEAIGQLAGGVAHDFNNLLTIINGYSELLLQTLSATDPKREMIDEIHKAGERSAALTRQLLAFSRQQVMATRVLDINEVLADTDKMLRRLIGEDIRFTTTLASDIWAVRADPGQIEQVLLNLAVNARDAMPLGGRLTIETRNVELDDEYVRNYPYAHVGPHVLLTVTDTGSGMTPEVQTKIFEPFFTTKGLGKGTGLGLATVYGIVKQSGGHIGVVSHVGDGTTFRIYLPQVEKASESNRPSGIPLPPQGTETVLLVEDEDGVRTLTRHVLGGCGYTVLEAANGDEAMRVAARHDGLIHLLISDVVMPGAGGRIVAERMAARYPAIRVLFVSGYMDDAIIRHGILREGVHFLQKPFSPAALAFKVREVLDTIIDLD